MKNSIIKDVIIVVISSTVATIISFFLVKTYLPINKLDNNKKSVIYEKNSLSKAIDKIYKATVLIKTYKTNDSKGNGSGFIYKVDNQYAYILTNEHILRNKDVDIILYNNIEENAEVLGKDKYLDLAVLRINKKNVEQTAILSENDNTQVGDTVFTVGSPIDYNYQGTITAGILSAKDRLVSTNTSDSKDANWIMKVLQTDAPINPGNSGGPLLNANGEVIGICTMKLINEDIEGMGFAIPINEVIKYVDNLEKNQEIKRPSIGLDVLNIDDDAKLLDNKITIKKDIDYGVVVKKNLTKNKNDLKKGDIIIKINDNKINDIATLNYEIFNHKVGDKIKITYIRGKKENKTNMVLIQ